MNAGIGTRRRVAAGRQQRPGGTRHDYDNNPQPGVEDLDTSYLLGFVRDFD